MSAYLDLSLQLHNDAFVKLIGFSSCSLYSAGVIPILYQSSACCGIIIGTVQQHPEHPGSCQNLLIFLLVFHACERVGSSFSNLQ